MVDRKTASRKPIKREHSKNDAVVINDTKVFKTQSKKVRFIDDEFIFNGKKVPRAALANQGVSIGCKGGVLTINRKKVPGVKANDPMVIEWNKGILKVNGNKKGFYGIKGKGSVVLERNSFKGYNDDEYEDTDMDLNLTIGMCKAIKRFYVLLLDCIFAGKDDSSDENERTENNNNIIKTNEVPEEVVEKQYNPNRRRGSTGV
ncbi:uncharacterized protein LOC126833008 [Adelges cooleyi]|uniref:uncharacterized protein LOC126833008 n=1 Tax=Adelges cooleyi TaxID=133065 RepID=UPI00217FFBBE|nr:uncharacterized protein LOC126833008 [Adelges cooleyi]